MKDDLSHIKSNAIGLGGDGSSSIGSITGTIGSDSGKSWQQQQQLVFLTGGSNPIEAGYGTLKIAEADSELTEVLRLTRVPLAFLKEEKAAEEIWNEHVAKLEAEERYRLGLTRFLDASTHLYMRVCPSVRPSVGPAFLLMSRF